MSAGFTPGPWKAKRAGSHRNILDIEGDGRLLGFTAANIDQSEANARLIAAAPELYEACQSAIPSGVCLTNRNIPDEFTVALDCTMGDLRKIAAALAKARGEQ